MSNKVTDFTLSDVANMLNVHRDTILYWEDSGYINKPRRNPQNNYRVYSIEEIREIAATRGLSIDL